MSIQIRGAEGLRAWLQLAGFCLRENGDASRKLAVLDFKYVVFVHSDKTADFQTTKGILEILDREGNNDDVIAFLEERNLPLDEIGRVQLAEKIMHERPMQGYLTISNALQWRLQYGRVISLASKAETDGVENLIA